MEDTVRGPVLFSVKKRVRPVAYPRVELAECERCDASIGPCTDWPWHYPGAECRDLRKAIEEP